MKLLLNIATLATTLLFVKSKSLLPCKLEDFKDIFSINCSGLRLKAIPQHFMSNIKILNLNNNLIERLSDNSLVHYSKIHTLRLKNCHLNVIEEFALRPLKKLSFLDLSNNELVDIPQNIFELPKLYVLDLSKNHLTDNALQLGKIVSMIMYLDLGFNNLSKFPQIESFTELFNLDIKDNRINEISIEHIAPLCKLEELIVLNNPIDSASNNCKCAVLKNWIAQRNITIFPKFKCQNNDSCVINTSSFDAMMKKTDVCSESHKKSSAKPKRSSDWI